MSWIVAASSFVLMVVTGMLALWGTPPVAAEPIPRAGLRPLHQQVTRLTELADLYQGLASDAMVGGDSAGAPEWAALARSAEQDSATVDGLLEVHGFRGLVVRPKDGSSPSLDVTTGVGQALEPMIASVRHERAVQALASTLASWPGLPTDIRLALTEIAESSRSRSHGVADWVSVLRLRAGVRDAQSRPIG